jgi:hypothetical protein
MEQRIQTGQEGMAEAFTVLFNLAMRMERDRLLGAGPCFCKAGIAERCQRRALRAAARTRSREPPIPPFVFKVFKRPKSSKRMEDPGGWASRAAAAPLVDRIGPHRLTIRPQKSQATEKRGHRKARMTWA